ncbi:MAG: Uma2 family endonuclease [Candidatus Tectomicrobia bacterium]|nr:Uma2 family endonuclease [Candidatus Tectomicrobia bacterium]
MALLQDLSEHLQIYDPEERQMISRVSWDQYEAVLADLGDCPVYHVTFLDGTLEIMSPSRRHEVNAENIGRLLEAYLEETRTRFWGLGSTTFRRVEMGSGTEPDKSYNLLTEKEFSDLAIEVIVTSGGVDKLEVYKRLGVTEVWFFQDNDFAVYRLQGETYERIAVSDLLPDLDLTVLAVHAIRPDPLEALIEYRRRVRGEA